MGKKHEQHPIATELEKAATSNASAITIHHAILEVTNQRPS